MSDRNNALSNLLSKYSSQPVEQFQHDSRQYQSQGILEQNYQGLRKQKQSDYKNDFYFENEDKMHQNKYLSDEQELDQCFNLLLNQVDNESKPKHASAQKTEMLTYSQTKILTPPKQKPSKKSKKQKASKNQAKPKFLNPLDPTSMQRMRQSDILKLSSVAKECLNSQSRLTDDMAKLGMKNSKALGMIRSRKEMQSIAEYLESGVIPAEYVKKLQEIVAE